MGLGQGISPGAYLAKLLRLCEVPRRFFIHTELLVHVIPVVVGLGELRVVEANSLGEVQHRLLVLAYGVVRDTPVLGASGVLRVAPKEGYVAYYGVGPGTLGLLHLHNAEAITLDIGKSAALTLSYSSKTTFRSRRRAGVPCP